MRRLRDTAPGPSWDRVEYVGETGFATVGTSQERCPRWFAKEWTNFQSKRAVLCSMSFGNGVTVSLIRGVCTLAIEGLAVQNSKFREYTGPTECRRLAHGINMSETFILIPGRTSQQGVGISEGKFKKTYQEQITLLQVPPEDMTRLGLKNDDRVRLTSEFGEIEVNITASKGDELPAGILFIAYGDLSSRLMGGDTHGSGMPTSKGLDVELELVDSESNRHD